jgi:hypothetical protein
MDQGFNLVNSVFFYNVLCLFSLSSVPISALSNNVFSLTHVSLMLLLACIGVGILI